MIVHIAKGFFEQRFSVDLFTAFSTLDPEIIERHVLSLNTPDQRRRTMWTPEKWQSTCEYLTAPRHGLESVAAPGLLRVKYLSVFQKLLPNLIFKYPQWLLFKMLDHQPLN